jgi:hypothetical protein
MRTVELLGDEKLDRAVRVAWRRLDQVGFLTGPAPGQVPPAAIAGVHRVLPVPVRLGGLRRWTPHISLARRVPPGQAALAAQAVGAR